MVENKLDTEGGEKLDEKADIASQKNSDLFLPNLTSRELIERWRSGSQDAARVLLARYEVRLVALVASRLNRRVRSGIAPEDVVQSAMGSFFRATSAGATPTLQLESNASAWNILATFTRRKLSRALERETAFKRGGGWNRTPLDQIEYADILQRHPSATDADEVLEDLNTLLSSDQALLLQLLLEDATQREIADRLQVDERTIRRRIAAIRSLIAECAASDPAQPKSNTAIAHSAIDLPNVSYRHFVLGKMIGSGGLGKVYRARMQQDGNLVAVKFMHRHLWSNSINKWSFLREIAHASRIDHPSILKYLGWGESPHGGPYILSELIQGTPLSKAHRGETGEAVQWLLQICHAVEAAHQAGVVHGDLTPNNILWADDARIVVTDFGFATGVHEPSIDSEQLRSLATTGGTLGFAAPEQLSPAFGHVSPATDVYAIGGLAHFLLTGRGPHAGQADSLLDTVSEEDVAVAEPHPAPDELKLATVARLALKKAVNRRPQSVRELTAVLAN